MALLENLIILYLATVVVEYLNKMGHFPSRIQFMRFLPLPKARAIGSESRWGGMIIYALLFTSIAMLNPDIFPIKVIGLVAWIMFIAHAILGSINSDIQIPKSLIGKITTEEIPNELWYVFIPLGILAFGLFCWYYISVVELMFSLDLNIPNALGLFNI